MQFCSGIKANIRLQDVRTKRIYGVMTVPGKQMVKVQKDAGQELLKVKSNIWKRFLIQNRPISG